ncbi:MAG: glycosyltransferase [Lachnospiraceae bacterium]|nr:glycosyltransferase [Lachnospiraceae bacterium]
MVSVIIPFYNCEKTAGSCIDSVLAQDYDDIEVICVDDGSTDKTVPFLMGCKLRDRRIRVFRQENKGPGEARNRGISEAKGEFITYVDGDDIISPGLISDLMKFSDKADVVMGGFSEVRADAPAYPHKVHAHEAFSGTCEEFAGKRLMGMLKDDTAYLIGSKLYRKSLIDDNGIRFDPDYRICEDAIFSVTALGHSKRVAISSSSGYFYVDRGENSLSAGYDSRGVRANSALYGEVIRFFGKDLDRRELDSYFARRYVGQLLRIYSMSDIPDEKKYSELKKRAANPVMRQVVSGADARRTGGFSYMVGTILLKAGKYRIFHRLCTLRYGK